MNGVPFSISGRPWILLSEEARKERRLSDEIKVLTDSTSLNILVDGAI